MAIEVTRAEQRERERMAMLLHDHVQQLLVSAKMQLEGLRRNESEIVSDDMSDVIAILEEVLESSRSLATELSPPVLKEGLAISLKWLADWVKEKHGLDVHAEVTSEVDAVGDEARALVFLAVREVLFNVVKHTDESEAFVILEKEGTKNLKVKIRDHGKGFDMEALKLHKLGSSGLGLFSLTERLSMIGGTLEIESSNGEGVQATIIVPRAMNTGED